MMPRKIPTQEEVNRLLDIIKKDSLLSQRVIEIAYERWKLNLRLVIEITHRVGHYSQESLLQDQNACVKFVELFAEIMGIKARDTVQKIFLQAIN
jgi:DNA-directed RNA polymerase subunit F